jgi:hypothetical protein
VRGKGGEGEVPDPLCPRLQPGPPAQQAVQQELLTVLCIRREIVSATKEPVPYLLHIHITYVVDPGPARPDPRPDPNCSNKKAISRSIIKTKTS